MVKLIGLAGKRGSGKTAIANVLQYQCRWHHPEVHVFNFADALKSVCATLEAPDCPEENVGAYYEQRGKTENSGLFGLTRGELLQQVGGALRYWQPEIWVEVTMKMVRATLAAIDDSQLVVVADVRYPNEADAIRAAGGVVVNVVGDPMKQQGDGTRDDSHPSEVALDDYRGFDCVIHNAGTLDDLREQVKCMLSFLTAAPDLILRLTPDFVQQFSKPVHVERYIATTNGNVQL